jgi:hypothetical protein
MAQGVKLVRLSEGASLVSVTVCEGAEEDAEPEAPAETETAVAAETDGAEAPNPPAEA